MPRSKPIEVVVIGATCLDIKALPIAPVVPRVSNPARIRLSYGGAGRNMAENLSRLGVRTALLSVVGTDPIGEALLVRTAQAGVDVSRVIRSQEASTGAYLALYAQENEKGYALDDVAQLKLATPEYVHEHRNLIRGAKMVLMDGNVDTETIGAILNFASEYDVPVGVDPVSVRRAHAIRPYLSEFRMVSPNREEAEALVDATIAGIADALEAARKMVTAGVGVAVVTLGEEGLVYVTSEGTSQAHGRIPSVRGDVLDLTGAGAALAATVVYGLINEMSVDECMRLGVAAAALTIKSRDSVSADLNLDQLYANMVI